jgi:hypothetical protein
MRINHYNTTMIKKSPHDLACETLGVTASNVWEKAGKPITKAGSFAALEALRVIESGVLSKQELALLVLAGVELFSIRTNTPWRIP